MDQRHFPLISFYNLELFFSPAPTFPTSSQHGFSGETADASLRSQSSYWYRCLGIILLLLVDPISPESLLNELEIYYTPRSINAHNLDRGAFLPCCGSDELSWSPQLIRSSLVFVVQLGTLPNRSLSL
jgi:hypothetical protein